MTSRRGKRGLSEDDLAVWTAVSRKVKPLTTDRRAISSPRSADAFDPAPVAKVTRPDGLPPFRVGERSTAPPPADNLAPTLAQRIAAHPVRMDAKTFARMKRGKLRPERKLDLHGMTLAQAHPALIRFVMQAHADGVRLIVVVTGKGRDRADDGPIPAPRGLLRHHVPGWLHAAPLRALVLQVTDAHVRHGGSGAYYVYLRRAQG